MRIEYAGFELQPGENAPALTLAGCGSATEVDFVQAHRSLGDGVRVLGGSVDLRHVVSTLAARDSFDWSDGWVGRAQFLIAQRPGDDALDGRSNQANPGAEPVSQPVVYNATLIGSSGTGNGIEFRSGSGGLVRNAILAGHGGVSVDVIGDDSAARYGAGALDVAASLFFENGAAPGYDDWPEGFDADLFDEQDVFTPPPTGNTFGVDPLLGQPLDENAPDFAPAPGSPALSGGATPPGDGFFDTAATYRGALDAQNGWLASWTAYPTSQTPADSGTTTIVTGMGSPPVLDITADATWSGTIRLMGGVQVYVEDGATLTVEAGTLVKGSLGAALVVTTTGRLEASGTPALPIVFTSDQPSGSAAPGDLGGLFLLGRAPINVPGGESEVPLFVPEPASSATSATALAALLSFRRRRGDRPHPPHP